MSNEWKYIRHDIINSVRQMVNSERRPLTYMGILDRLMTVYGKYTPTQKQLGQWVRLDARDLQIIFVRQVAHICPRDELDRFMRGGYGVLINK